MIEIKNACKNQSPEQKNEVFRKKWQPTVEQCNTTNDKYGDYGFFEVDNNTAAKNKHINSKYINFFLLN